MGKFIDLTEQSFERLTVIKRVPSKKLGETLWLCSCSCGNTTITSTGRLRAGKCRSCGCLHIESARKQGLASSKHNHTNTRLYRIWSNMKTRCYNKNNKKYSRWGGRGIYVCNEWKNNFEVFYNWAIKSGYAEDKTIDRIDNDGPYSPDNCRWTTFKVQANNTRKNVLITFNGETHTEAEWCNKLGIGRATLCYRLKRYSVEEALTAPVVKGGNTIKKLSKS